ncbi:hypothetical protein ABZW49_10280 [Nonomuraea wenchangensis]
MPWNPDEETFGEYLRGGAPLGKGRTADVVVGERTWVTQDQVREGRTEAGERFKQVTDQCGNQVTERTDSRGKQRKDVTIILR